MSERARLQPSDTFPTASVTQEFVIPHEWRGDGVLAWLAGEDELANFVLPQKISPGRC